MKRTMSLRVGLTRRLMRKLIISRTSKPLGVDKSVEYIGDKEMIHIEQKLTTVVEGDDKK